MLAKSRSTWCCSTCACPGSTASRPARASARRHGPALPVIMLTAFGDPTSVRKGYEAGADDFLQKPVDTPQLVLKVRGLPAPQVAARRERSQPARGPGARPRPGPAARDRPRLVADRGAGGVPPHGHGAAGRLIGAPICLHRPLRAGHAHHGRGPARPRPGRRGRAEDPLRRAARVPQPVELPHRAALRQQPRAAATRASCKEMVQARGRGLGRARAHDLGGRGARPHRRRQQAGRLHRADVQLLSIFAGPAASFLRSRQIFDAAARATPRGSSAWPRWWATWRRWASRAALLVLAVDAHRAPTSATTAWPSTPRTATAIACAWRRRRASGPRTCPWTRRCCAGRCAGRRPCRRTDARRLQRGGRPRARRRTGPRRARGACASRRRRSRDEELNLLSALAGQLAVALQKSERTARRPSGWPRQMATLYDLGLETTALRDLRPALRQGDRGGGPADPRRPHLGPALRPRGRMAAACSRPGPATRAGETLRRAHLPPGRGHRGPGGPRPRARDGQRARRASGLRARGATRWRACCACPSTYYEQERRPGAVRRAERHAAAGRAALHPGGPRVPDPLRRPALDRGRQLHGLRGGARAQRAARARQRAACARSAAPCPASASWRRRCAASTRPSSTRWSPSACPTPTPARYRIAAVATPRRRARRGGRFPHARGHHRPRLPREAHRRSCPTWPRTPTTSASSRRRAARSPCPSCPGDEVVAVLNVESDDAGRLRPQRRSSRWRRWPTGSASSCATPSCTRPSSAPTPSWSSWTA